MKTLTVLLATATLATVALCADDPAQQVDQIFARFDRRNSPGCSVGVIRNGSFVYKKSFGSASLELGVPLSPESVFYLGSVSKQFTAASIALAAEQGYVSLDDDVRKYLAELPDYGHPVTLRTMLHQTSGFRDFFYLILLAGRNPADLASPDDLFRVIARQKGLNNVPGAEWIYSNSNYFLLGMVIQRATKKSLAQFAAENIFQPLGMTHSLFYDDNTLVVPNRVAAYDPGKNGNFVVDWSTTYDIVGGGGVLSTIDDLLLWDRNFYSNKLGGTLVKELLSPGTLNNGNQINYALGLSLGGYRGLPTVEHGGALFGYRSEFLRFPEQRFSVIALCNVADANPGGLAQKVADIYLAADFKPDTTAMNSSGALPDPAVFAGTYLDLKSKTIYKFSAEDGNLIGWGAALRRIRANTFHDLGDGVITFDNNNGSMHCSLRIPGELYFSGSRIQPLEVSETELARFAGVYRSEELDVTYKLSVVDGKLTMRFADKPPIKLEPVTPHEFYSTDLALMPVLLFRNDAAHHVSGFSLFTQAARGIRFTRVRPPTVRRRSHSH